MNITSTSIEGEQLALEKCNKLEDNLEEFYTILLQMEKLVHKLKMVGTYERYINREHSTGVCLVDNLSKGHTWNGYQIVYIPDEVTVLGRDFFGTLSGKILAIGPGKIREIDWRIPDDEKFGVTDIILACDLSELTFLDGGFMHLTTLESLVIYGSIYGHNYVKTKQFTPISLESAFSSCYRLKSLIITNTCFDKLKNMRGAFYRDGNLIEIIFDGFEYAYLDSIEMCFSFCKSLSSLNLSGINTEDCISFDRLFLNNKRLEDLKLGPGFKTTNVKKFSQTFDMCESLKSIDIKHWKIRRDAITDKMFRGCTKLRHTGIARIDLQLNTFRNRLIE